MWLDLTGVQGKAYDGKTDVWAIGCVLYEMCALKKAFDASNLGAITVKVMRYATQTSIIHDKPQCS